MEEDLNQIAIERGPLVFCVEFCDTEAKDLGRLMIPVDAQFEERFTEIKGHKILILESTGLTYEDSSWYNENALYQTVEDFQTKRIRFRMVPYFAWDNRGMGEMIIWMPAFWGKQR